MTAQDIANYLAQLRGIHVSRDEAEALASYWVALQAQRPRAGTVHESTAPIAPDFNPTRP